MTTPRIVLDPGVDLAAAIRELERVGWRVQHGFAVLDEPWDLAPDRVVLAGDVAGEAAALVALMAAVRGAGLAVRLDRSQPWAATFLADLARLDVPQVAPDRRVARGGREGVAAAGRVAALDRRVARGGAAGVGRPDRAGAPDPPALTPEQRQLLDLLAGGASIAQAARQLYLSLRTANRRVATARDALGVGSTREAVLAYVRMRGG